MNRKIMLLRALLAVFVLCGTSAVLSAEDLDQIRDRMEERLSEIDDLKEQGRVGENNQALLTILGDISPEQEKMIKAENSDRLKVYEIIAEKTNQPIKKVQKQRAAQLAKNSAPGVYLQDAEGKWYRKKP